MARNQLIVANGYLQELFVKFLNLDGQWPQYMAMVITNSCGLFSPLGHLGNSSPGKLCEVLALDAEGAVSDF